MDTPLIEASPARPLTEARFDRDRSIIEGATLIGSTSVNGSTRKRRYSEAALRKIASMAEGLPGYLNHTAPELAFKPRDVKELAVRHQNVRYDPSTQTVKSDMHVLEHHAPLVFNLAAQFGDHIGNSLVSRGVVAMEGDVEVVTDIVQLRSADLVSDPASTKGLFESRGSEDAPVTITDLIEAAEQRAKTRPSAQVRLIEAVSRVSPSRTLDLAPPRRRPAIWDDVPTNLHLRMIRAVGR